MRGGGARLRLGPGLASRVWLADPETNTYGGVYTFTSRAALDAYVDGELFAAIRADRTITNLLSSAFEVLDAPTRTTRGIPAVAERQHAPPSRGEAEALIVVEGTVELHGREGVTRVGPGEVVFVLPDTEHALRTPEGGRWLAIWPIRARIPGTRYASSSG